MLGLLMAYFSTLEHGFRSAALESLALQGTHPHAQSSIRQMLRPLHAACLPCYVTNRNHGRTQDAAYGAELQFSDLAATQASYLSQRSEAPAPREQLLPLGGSYGGSNG